MNLTSEIIRKSVTQQPFGSFEPFVSGDEKAVAAFYDRVVVALKKLPTIRLLRESDHHGSGYASYVSLFLYPSDGHTQQDFPDFVQTDGLLLYVSRLAPVAVFALSSRTSNKNNGGCSSGFIEAGNVGILPDDWSVFLGEIKACLQFYEIELLDRDPLLDPAPQNVTIPTVFDGPYYVFDTLFYWED